MSHHVCPWWLGYLLASPLRRLIENPAKILAPYVRSGMTVIEPGPGMGFFTIDLARLVGTDGRVIAIDLQPQMLRALKRRAAKAGLLDRIDARCAEPNRMGVEDLRGRADFVLAFHVVHELPDTKAFFVEMAAALKPEGSLLLVEPRGHVSPAQFDEEVEAAKAAGLTVATQPEIRRSRSVLLRKTA